MKIYNRRGFAASLIALGVGLAGMAALVVKELDIRLLFSTVFLLGAGGYYLPRSLSKKASKEDKLLEEDERDLFIEMKAKSMSFRIALGVAFGLLIFSVLGYGITKAQEWVLASLFFGSGCAFLWIVWLITWIYYEKHF